MKVIDVLTAIGAAVGKVERELIAIANRNPDAKPALVAFQAFLETAVTAEAIAAAPIKVPAEIIEWLTHETTDVVGDDSDQG